MAKARWPTWEESRRRREKAIALRKQGKSYKEIRAIVGGAMASMSLWLRDIPVPPEHRARLRRRSREAAAKAALSNHRNRLKKEAEIRRESLAQVGRVSDRDLFVAGVLAYAAEGSKKKPWRSSCKTVLVNSDPRMIRLFLRWLDLVGIDLSSVSFRVSIHEDADVAGAVRFWSEVVGVPEDRFQRTTLKRGNPRTRRRNTGALYRGCLVVHVYRSGNLNKRLEGWFDAIVNGPSHDAAGPSIEEIRRAVAGDRVRN